MGLGLAPVGFGARHPRYALTHAFIGSTGASIELVVGQGPPYSGLGLASGGCGAPDPRCTLTHAFIGSTGASIKLVVGQGPPSQFAGGTVAAKLSRPLTPSSQVDSPGACARQSICGKRKSR